ncbi:hypothetical protein AB0467_06010 [Streptomyces sp. NPDC052095]|uniref:hypothetical protein n=1 Tax=unclassified Streptomyces TaxID=2593676 RepID=UPI00344FE2F3
MQDAEQNHDDEQRQQQHQPQEHDGTVAAGAAVPAEEDADWFDDVPEENVGSVLSLDELAPYPGI